MNDLEQPTDNRQEEVKRMDPYVNKLPELVREQKTQIDDLKNVQRRLKKNLMKVVVTAVILGVLLVVTGFFPIRTTIVPWLRENLVTESTTEESALTDSPTTESVVVESSTSESSVSEPTVTDESDAENVEQEKDPSATDNQESDNSTYITTFELDGVTFNFPVHTDDLLQNGWQMSGENQDSANPDLIVQSLYDAAGSSAYLYKTAEGTVTQVSIGLATPETTCFGLHQGQNFAEVDAVFQNAENRVSENAESTEGKGVVTYVYSGYSIKVTLINGGVSSAELMLN